MAQRDSGVRLHLKGMAIYVGWSAAFGTREPSPSSSINYVNSLVLSTRIRMSIGALLRKSTTTISVTMSAQYGPSQMHMYYCILTVNFIVSN